MFAAAVVVVVVVAEEFVPSVPSFFVVSTTIDVDSIFASAFLSNLTAARTSDFCLRTAAAAAAVW